MLNLIKGQTVVFGYLDSATGKLGVRKVEVDEVKTCKNGHEVLTGKDMNKGGQWRSFSVPNIKNLTIHS